VIFIYHAGTGTIIDSDDEVYLINTADMTETEYKTLVDGDDAESLFQAMVDASRATPFKEAF
jgi:hypothetical protein